MTGKDVVLYVSDTVLYVAESVSSIKTSSAHIRTKSPWRVSDGLKHPVVRINSNGTQR